jgi:hypothetical protein
MASLQDGVAPLEHRRAGSGNGWRRPHGDVDTREADTTTARRLGFARQEAGNEVVRVEPSGAIELEPRAMWGVTT